MDEFKPEDELKPDTSDRRPTRQQKRSSSFSVPKITLSRQHLMIGIGVLVLLLLIVGIGSALRAPSHPQSSQPQSPSAGEKSIDLSSSTPMTQGAETPTPVDTVSNAAGQQPQTLSAPPISGTPTEAQPQPPVSGQQRIELPGNITDALAQQQGRVNEFSQGAAGASTLPTAPATVAPAAKAPVGKPAHGNGGNSAAHSGHATHAASKPAAPKAAASTAANKPAAAGPAGAGSSIQNAPASHFTLQLSGASRPDTLRAYAQQHNLAHSWVYETKRDGKSWYVLVNGVYASSTEAKRAIATLPADVQAKKPWVKPIRQVKQDLNK
ncbi:SPOR domain-containing protein [Brenneria sp. g21c3]|uniref:SPOR domain-containing protein n=1 Tax=Brenneria sp. g21c3 TaxID=3093893 RepID=UPI002EC004B4|nr:SPOR domain-containing protein [Brenneria sp. g21c3]